MEDVARRAERLRQEIGEAERATGGERRRQEVLERATADELIDRETAEEVYDLALEESLEPAYALALVRSGLLVQELVPPERSEDTTQQDTPPWLEGTETSDEMKQERRLRASLRRLRAMLHRELDAVHAVNAYLAEPDVAGD